MDEFEQMEQHEIPEDHPLEESPGETLDRNCLLYTSDAADE